MNRDGSKLGVAGPALQRIRGVDGELALYTPETGNPFVSEAKLISDELFRHDVYGAPLQGVRRGGTVVDVGANIGLFALRVRRARRDVAVVCIEPVPANLEALRANVADN